MSRTIPNSSANYVQAPDSASLDVTGTIITLAAWVRPNTVAGTKVVCGKWQAGTHAYVLYLASGKIILDCGNAAGSTDGVAGGGSGVVAGATTLTTGVWSHIAAIKNSAVPERRVWLNGVSDGVVGSTGITIGNSTQPFQMGVDGFGNTFDGRIGEVAVWAEALSTAEILALSKGIPPHRVHPSGLRGYWPLWGVAYPEPDLTGNANHATQTGAVAAADHAPTAPVGGM